MKPHGGYGFVILMKKELKASGGDIVSENPRDDEISLVELVRILVEHRQTILAVFVCFLIAGTVFALLIPKQYRYTTTIEIGAVLEDGKTQLIDPPGTLLAKINEAYIPHALEQPAEEKSEDYKITARIPRDSEVIVLESKAAKSQGDTLIKLHKQVVDYAKQNHQGVFEVIKKEMDVELDKSRNKLSALKDRHKMLTAGLKRLDQTSKLLGEQIDTLKTLVADAASNRKMARTQTGDETQAMTLLMIDNEIQQNSQRLAELEERLHIELPREKDLLKSAISDNLRERQEQSAEIAKAQIVMDNMRETRMLIAPMRSAAPVGVGRAIIVMLSAVVGFFAGIFAAFIAAFIRKMREELHVLEEKR